MMQNKVPLIALLTDFGLVDEYIGVMKGVLHSGCPEARIVDLCHQLPPQNVVRAAAMLRVSYPYFPPETVHLVVVDPGVGTDRHILIVEAEGQRFVAPDNGVLTAPLQSLQLQSCHRLSRAADPAISATFHGRDIMAPAAARLASGTPPAALGIPVSPELCVIIETPRAQMTEAGLTGEITGVDRFGNLATSIAREQVEALGPGVEVHVGDTTISGLHRTFSDVASGEPVALIDSRGYLEIAINGGNAGRHLCCGTGTIVKVTPSGA